MKSKPLISSINLPRHSLDVKVDSQRLRLTCQTCHCLFNSKQQKERFIDQFDAPDIAIIPCDGGKYHEKLVALDSIDTLDALNKRLHCILRGQLPSMVLNTLIIDNISMFYWDIKILNESNYTSLGYDDYAPAAKKYQELIEVIQAIKKKYLCNVIVTSLDFNFEKGYNVNWSHHIPNRAGLGAMSFLPAGYLLQHDVLLHLDGETTVFNKETKQWTTVTNGIV